MKKNERKEKKKKEYCTIHVLDGLCLLRGELRQGVFFRTPNGIMTLKSCDHHCTGKMDLKLDSLSFLTLITNRRSAFCKIPLPGQSVIKSLSFCRETAENQLLRSFVCLK